MEKISNYVNNVFSSLPKTKDMSDLKQNIIDSMNEKYNELLRQGKNDNEAFGIVVSEFGDIDEIKKEWMEEKSSQRFEEERSSSSEKKFSQEVIPIDPQRESAYIAEKSRFSFILPFAISLFFLAVILIINSGEGLQYVPFFSVKGLTFFSYVAFFLLVALGVGLIVYFGNRLCQYDDVQLYYKSIYNNIASGGSYKVEDYKRSMYEQERKKFNLVLPFSIALFILSVIPPLYFDIYQKSNETLGITLLLILVCIGVVLLVHFAYRLGLYEDARAVKDGLHYQNTGELPSSQEEGHPYTGVVFIAATVIYLGLGFFANLWHPGWIIYIIAAGIATVLNISYKQKH